MLSDKHSSSASNGTSGLKDCPYCGDTASRPIVPSPCVVACIRCGLYRLVPRMDRSGQIAHIEAINAHIELTKWRTPVQGLRGTGWEINLLKRWVPSLFTGGRVLDVGTAEGTFVMSLKEAGTRAIGLEPIGRLATFARSYGLDVRTARFDLASIPADLFTEPFDLICFRECWYYLPDLQEVFDLLRALLAPGGYIYIKAAQGQSIYFRLWPTKYLSRYNPTVAGIPTPAAMRYIFREEGFHVRHLRDHPEKTLWTLGLPFSQLTRVGNLIIDPFLRPLLRHFSMYDRLILLASRESHEVHHV